MLTHLNLADIPSQNCSYVLETQEFCLFKLTLQGSSHPYALKIYKDNDEARKYFHREKHLMGTVKSKYLIKPGPEKLVKDKISQPFILCEYAINHNLLHLIQNVKRLDETIARSYFQRLIKGLMDIHKHGYVHMDIKLENLFLDSEYKLMIGDFDCSQSIEDPSLKGRGTPNYRAPEIVDGSITEYPAADVFSAGVVLFMMVIGRFPFSEINEKGKISLGLYDLFKVNKEKFWELHLKDTGVTPTSEFIALVDGMLEYNPYKRLKMKDIKNSSWYKKSKISSKVLKREILNTLKNAH